jgi:hypothetical protein
MVMKSAEDGRRYDAAHVLDRPMDRCVLIERPMSRLTMDAPECGVGFANYGLAVDTSGRANSALATSTLPARKRSLLTPRFCRFTGEP